MRTVAVIVLVVATLPAAAAPKKVVRDAPQLTDAQKTARRTMAAELRRGRALAGKGQHADAVAAFDAALAAVPDEPHVLLELGWELRVAGNLARAEEICRKAAQAGEPALRAPALYNLGRVLEQKGDKPGAIAAYTASLTQRENTIVRERLLDLDPTAQSDATRPRPLEGPVPSVEAWCAAHKDRPCSLDEGVRARLEKPQPPWLDARVFTIGDDTERDCVAALRTARGWFVAELDTCANGEFRAGVEATLEAEDLLSNPGAELKVTLHGTDAMKDYDAELGRSVCCLEAEFTSIVVCGLGKSQVPNCTPTIELLPPLGDNAGKVGDVGLEPRFAGDELTLVRTDGKPADDKKVRLDPSLRAIIGRHRITFP